MGAFSQRISKHGICVLVLDFIAGFANRLFWSSALSTTVGCYWLDHSVDFRFISIDDTEALDLC